LLAADLVLGLDTPALSTCGTSSRRERRPRRWARATAIDAPRCSAQKPIAAAPGGAIETAMAATYRRDRRTSGMAIAAADGSATSCWSRSGSAGAAPAST
jgi:hypothetical protein